MIIHREIVNPARSVYPEINLNVLKHYNPGSYTLVIHLDREVQLTIGRLGAIWFTPAFYTYSGSALSPGGLRARVRRHLRHGGDRREHWHVDRLLNAGSIMEVWWQVGNKRWECEWATALSTVGARYVPGFGASDCRCPGHLVSYNSPDSVTAGYLIIQNLQETNP